MNLFLFLPISKTAMLIKISKLLIHRLLWKIVGFMSSIVAFTCFAMSPSFKDVFGRWNLFKGIIYSIFSLSAITMMLFVNKCRRFNTRSVMVTTIVGFIVMMLTSLCSMWQDINSQKDEKGWYGRILKLCYFVAFGLMSLSWSRQLELGFEVGISNFLFGSFLVLLMKMNFKFIPLAALVCYVVLYIRFYSDHLRQMHSHDDDSGDSIPEDIETGIVSHNNIDLQPLIPLQAILDHQREMHSDVDSDDTVPEDIETGISHNNDSQPLMLKTQDDPKEWVAQVEPGVHITFVSLPNGENDLKRIRFSREMFNKWQAQRWWGENYDRIMELYNVQSKSTN